MLRYVKEEQYWERLPETNVSYSHSSTSGQVQTLTLLPQLANAGAWA